MPSPPLAARRDRPHRYRGLVRASLAAALVGALFSASSPAQEPTAPPIAVLIRDVEVPGPRPTPLARPLPAYPKRALASGIEGSVELAFDVTALGSVSNPRIENASDGLFGSAALSAVAIWTFEPALFEGKAVAAPGQKTRMLFTISAAMRQQLQAMGGGEKRSAFGSNKRQSRSSLSAYQRDPRFLKRLAAAIEFFHNDQYEEALEELGRYRMKSLNALERAEAYRIFAYIENARDQKEAARSYLRKSIAQDALSREENAEMLFQIAQLYLSEQRWPEVIKTLHEWFADASNPNSGAYFLLALAHFQNQDLEAAYEPARQAVVLSKSPREPWLRLLLALELTSERYETSIPILEQLVEFYPKKAYWVQLSTVNGALGRYEESLIPLQLAYSQELLDQDTEYRRLAQLLLYLDLPYRAAEVVRTGIEKGHIDSDSEAYELLGNSYIQSKDFNDAVGPIERAAELSTAGDLYLRLAQVHSQRENWKEAAAALAQALEKGDLAKPGEAHFLMGVAYYNQKQPKQAMRWFSRAKRHDDTRKDATSWLRYIERELNSG